MRNAISSKNVFWTQRNAITSQSVAIHASRPRLNHFSRHTDGQCRDEPATLQHCSERRSASRQNRPRILPQTRRTPNHARTSASHAWASANVLVPVLRACAADSGRAKAHARRTFREFFRFLLTMFLYTTTVLIMARPKLTETPQPRNTVQLPAELHHQIKIHAALERTTIPKLIGRLVKAQLPDIAIPEYHQSDQAAA
ncbi:unnamed protein product [Sphagnum balticum]